MRLTVLFSMMMVAGIATAQTKALHYKELQKHLPTEILGYEREGDPDGNSFEMNGMSYSSASLTYVKGDSEITVSILDYHSAEGLYQTSSMAWSMGMSFEDDQTKAHGIEIDGMPGWVSWEKEMNEVNIVLGAKERYFVSVSITDTDDIEMAKKVVETLNLADLP